VAFNFAACKVGFFHHWKIDFFAQQFGGLHYPLSSVALLAFRGFRAQNLIITIINVFLGVCSCVWVIATI
jgi:hypothetical protein